MKSKVQPTFADAGQPVHVFRYEGPAPPTLAASVTPDTRLSELNLNWGERDLPERIRTKHVHRLHPYLGKYIPQLVEVFLRKYFKTGDLVVDPFVGSGTTLVQAQELGVDSLGFDISAFNVLLANAKVAEYDLVELNKVVTETLRHATVPLSFDAGLFRSEYSTATSKPCSSKYLHDWFHPMALSQLLRFRSAANETHSPYRELLLVTLCRAARSARRTTHFDLDFPREPVTEPYYCHKHRRICKPTEDASRFLQRYALDSIKRVADFQRLRSGAHAIAVHQDSRECNLPRVSGVITSPPYVGLIDYHAQHEYAYHLLNLEDRREQEIGAAAANKSRAAIAAYAADITGVFERLLDAMPRGGPLVVIAGDRHGLYPEIARNLGVTVEAEVQRHVNRRTGRRSHSFYESVFVWRKR